MDTGFAVAAAAMEKALRRLDAVLTTRAAVFRSLADQHGQATLELRQAREELQALRAEAEGLRERASLVDALRIELAAMQADHDRAPAEQPAPEQVAEILAQAAEIARLRLALDEARAFERQLLQRLETTMAGLRECLVEPAD